MHILLDARPFLSQKSSLEGIYSEDLLQALFRNFPSDTFYIWTAGRVRPTSIFSFSLDIYPNVKCIHSHIKKKKIDFFLKYFSYPKIDDIAETEAMKKGLLPWIGKIDVAIFLAPYPSPVEDNCVKVSCVNDFSALHFPEYFSPSERKIHTKSSYKKEFSSADVLVVPSKFVKDDLLKIFRKEDEEKIFIMGSGILEIESLQQNTNEDILKTEEERKAEKKEEEKVVDSLPSHFFFVRGIFSELHNLSALMKAYALFASRFGKNAWSLVIEEEKLGDLSDFSQKHSHCIVLPPLSLKERVEVLEKADTFLYPSLYDGVGKPVLEAMRCGTPVLSSCFGSLPEVYEKTALSFDPTSYLSLLDGMKRVFTHEKIRNDIAEAGKKRSYESQFLWDDIALRFMDLLESSRDAKDEALEQEA